MSLEKEIRDFIVENFLFGADGERIDGKDSFLEKGIIDSTGVLEIINFLESRYGISVVDEDLVAENLDSIENIVGFVTRKKDVSGEGATLA
jgi:acyl carrier protein